MSRLRKNWPMTCAAAYDTVRSVPTRFVVAPGHQDDELERIVEVHAAFVVVEKVHHAAGYPRPLTSRGAG
jgi:pyruvate-formate lyase-activating enzyme